MRPAILFLEQTIAPYTAAPNKKATTMRPKTRATVDPISAAELSGVAPSSKLEKDLSSLCNWKEKEKSKLVHKNH